VINFSDSAIARRYKSSSRVETAADSKLCRDSDEAVSSRLVLEIFNWAKQKHFTINSSSAASYRPIIFIVTNQPRCCFWRKHR